MQLEVGKIYEGKVTGITKFGAFIDLGAVSYTHLDVYKRQEIPGHPENSRNLDPVFFPAGNRRIPADGAGQQAVREYGQKP